MAYQNLARRFKFLRASFRRHGGKHVAEVFKRELIRRRYARNPPAPSTPETLRLALGASQGDSQFYDRFHRSLTRRLPFSLSTRRDFQIALLAGGESDDDILAAAESFVEGRFPMLGLCVDEPTREFDWHRDYLGEHSYATIPHHRIDFMGGSGGDVKYVWELNRCYWIGWLGRAYWISSNTVWGRDFTRLVDSWIQENPFNIGVNWAMPMEVAIRSFWLLMGYAFFAGTDGIEDSWWERYLSLLWDHGVYLESNLEYFSNLTNHYISNLLGLVAAGVAFMDCDRGRGWLVEGRRRIVEELERQILHDGVHYERSVCYHRLVLEFFVTASILLDRCALPLPQRALDAIERMSEFVADYSPPGGSVPQFGDSDDGVLLRMSPDQDLYDHRDTLSLAAAYFKRGDFRAVAGRYASGAAMLLGGEGFERFRAVIPSPPTRSTLYPEGGFGILRSDRMHVVTDVGPIGLHGNNDTLAYTLTVDGTPVVIDPGTYCYTRNPAIRNQLRSTAAHNAPAMGDIEIAEFDGLWRVANDDVGISIDEWEPGGVDRPTRLRAGHTAYALRAPGSRVEREWTLDNTMLRVVDMVTPDAPETFVVRLTLAPGLLFFPNDLGGRVTDGENGIDIVSIRSSVTPRVFETWSSPSYGVGVTSIAVEFSIPVSGRLLVEYLCPPSSTPS